MRREMVYSAMICAMILFGLPGSVLADSTGGSKIAVSSSSAEMARTAAKSALARQPLEAASQGRMGAYRFDDGVGRYPSYASLSTEGYIPQPDSDTCGPTAVRNALTNWGLFRTVDEIKPEVGFDGSQTPWSDRLQLTMNRQIEQNFYVRSSHPPQSLIWDAFIYDIPRNAPLILNVHMSKETDYLYGYYHNAEYWHFVIGTGYAGTSAASSSTIYYHDPFNRPSRLVGNPYGDHSDALGIFATILRDHGVVW